MVKASVTNFCIVGMMSILFILLVKSMATRYDMFGREEILAI